MISRLQRLFFLKKTPLEEHVFCLALTSFLLYFICRYDHLCQMSTAIYRESIRFRRSEPDDSSSISTRWPEYKCLHECTEVDDEVRLPDGAAGVDWEKFIQDWTEIHETVRFLTFFFFLVEGIITNYRIFAAKRKFVPRYWLYTATLASALVTKLLLNGNFISVLRCI